MPRKPTLEEIRVEFSRETRRAAIDLLQASNYFEHSEYMEAFENVENACDRMIERLKAVKARLPAPKPEKRR